MTEPISDEKLAQYRRWSTDTWAVPLLDEIDRLRAEVAELKTPGLWMDEDGDGDGMYANPDEAAQCLPWIVDHEFELLGIRIICTKEFRVVEVEGERRAEEID